MLKWQVYNTNFNRNSKPGAILSHHWVLQSSLIIYSYLFIKLLIVKIICYNMINIFKIYFKKYVTIFQPPSGHLILLEIEFTNLITHPCNVT